MTKRIAYLRWLLWLATAALLLGGCVMDLPEKGAVRAGAHEPLVLGVIAPLTGLFATEGEGIAQAVRLAVERHAPVAGQAVAVEVIDDGCDPARSEEAARTLAVNPRLVGIVGPACSAGCVAAGNLLHDAAVVMVSPRCTDVAVTRQGAEGVLRTAWTDAFEASAAARFAHFDLSAERAFVVHDGTVYGKNLRDVFRFFYGEDNLEGVSELRAGSDTGSVIRTIARSEARSIHYFGLSDGAAPFLRDLREAGITVPVMMSEAIDVEELVERVGGAAEGVRITRVLPPAEAPLSQFAARYREQTGGPPTPFAAEAYDAARAILEAVAETAEHTDGVVEIDRRELRFAVYTTDMNGVTGRLRFRPNGDRRQGARVEVQRIQAGMAVTERVIILPE